MGSTWYAPTWVKSGIVSGGGQTMMQNRRQRRKQSQWQSWMQNRPSSSRVTIAPNAFASPLSIAAPSFASSSGFFLSACVACANSNASATGFSIFTSGNSRQIVRQTSTQRQLQNHSQ